MRLIAIVGSLCLLASQLFAQQEGRIVGTVGDTTGSELSASANNA
jgi:hypothetical protein